MSGVSRFGPFALFAGSLWVDVLFEKLFKSLDVIFTNVLLKSYGHRVRYFRSHGVPIVRRVILPFDLIDRPILQTIELVQNTFGALPVLSVGLGVKLDELGDHLTRRLSRCLGDLGGLVELAQLDITGDFHRAASGVGKGDHRVRADLDTSARTIRADIV